MSDITQRYSTGAPQNLEERFASRAAHMKPSEIRSLFAVASRPEIVSLAGGMPNLSALPMGMMADVVNNLVRQNGQEALQYGNGQGHPKLREQICEVMALEGIRANPDDVLVTTGSQQALDLISRIFLDPQDVVLCEAPSYVGALGTFHQYEASVVHVETDENGLVPSALAKAIKSVRAAGRKIKFLYTIPNYQNPSGVLLPATRRTEILKICREASIFVVEDNPYGLLGFDKPSPNAMRAEDSENVIYLGSFSKTSTAKEPNCPLLRALATAALSMTSPLLKLMSTAPFFILRIVEPLIRFLVDAEPGTCNVTMSDCFSSCSNEAALRAFPKASLGSTS